MSSEPPCPGGILAMEPRPKEDGYVELCMYFYCGSLIPLVLHARLLYLIKLEDISVFLV